MFSFLCAIHCVSLKFPLTREKLSARVHCLSFLKTSSFSFSIFEEKTENPPVFAGYTLYFSNEPLANIDNRILDFWISALLYLLASLRIIYIYVNKQKKKKSPIIMKSIKITFI